MLFPDAPTFVIVFVYACATSHRRCRLCSTLLSRPPSQTSQLHTTAVAYGEFRVFISLFIFSPLCHFISVGLVIMFPPLACKAYEQMCFGQWQHGCGLLEEQKARTTNGSSGGRQAAAMVDAKKNSVKPFSSTSYMPCNLSSYIFVLQFGLCVCAKVLQLMWR